MPRGGKREGAGRPEKENCEKRSRNWSFIIYPESTPENWREQIDEMHVEWVESPLHNQDINPDGEIKKAHFHIVLLFPSDKSFAQIKAITDSLHAPIPVRCQSVKGSIRYMVHKDNPEKHQYNWNEIVCHGGADLCALCAPTSTERLQIQKDILDYILKAGIIEFEDITNYALYNHLDDWLNVLLNYSTLSINAYIRSRRHKVETGVQPPRVNADTGEVLDKD